MARYEYRSERYPVDGDIDLPDGAESVTIGQEVRRIIGSNKVTVKYLLPIEE